MTGPGGQLIPGNTEVIVLRSDGAGGWDSDSPRVFVDAATGGYTAPGLEAGTYRLLFEPQGRDWLSEWYADADDLETATDVVLADGALRTVDAELRPAGHLVGTVHGPDGQPVTAALLTAWPSNDGPPNGAGRGGDTDAQGRYDLGRLPPGTYRLQIQDDRGALPGEFWNDRPTFATATDIVVGLGQTVVLGDTVLGSPSVVTAPVPAVTLANSVRPTVSGRPVVGRRLKVDPGSWSPTGPTFAYQWFAGGEPIKRAKKARFKVTRALIGARLTVRVTATVAGLPPATATSKATKRVTARR